MSIFIPDTVKKRVVVVGGGFAGLNFIEHLDERYFQTVLIDKNNYHQFPPLLYQVASAGLEADSISFPFRKLFRRKKDFHFRLAELKAVHPDARKIDTSIGEITYNFLVLACGTTTNYYGNRDIAQEAFPMKTVEEALVLRNAILLNLEEALNCRDESERQSLLNIVIVGGGATGVEIAGAFAEMKRFVIPKDYPDLRVSGMNIYLIEGTGKLLGAMSEKASVNSLKFLEEMGVKVLLSKKVTDYREGRIVFDTGESIPAKTVIWVSGVVADRFEGFTDDQITHANRIVVDEFNRVKGTENIFAIGDICFQTEKNYPKGHPQVAPVAIQQGTLLAANLASLVTGKTPAKFHYNDKGTLATVGRNKAVADFPGLFLKGFPAWAVWLLVHLRYILGVRNKITVLFDWLWNYFSYDRSERFILFIPQKKK